MGVWGWFAALDADTGEIVWRMRSTGSDEDVGIGPRFKPFYPQYKGKDLGLKTWPEGIPKTGGGDGWFRAIDARSGEVLWQQKLSSGIVGQPMAYLGPDGRQYIAIAAGIGGQALSNQEGRAGMPARGSNTYVFSLGGERIEAEANVPEPEQVR